MKSVERKRGRPVDEAMRAQRREEILTSAAGVFAARGYQGTDMQAVADAAGVAKGTVYLYFASKEELFLAAVDQGVKSMKDYIDAAIEGLTDPLERIGKAVRAYLGFFKEHPEQVELWIQERAEFRDRKQPAYFDYREAGKAHWHALLKKMIDEGRLRGIPVERVDDVLSDLVYGTMFTNHFSGRHKPLDAQAGDILDIVFHGILSEAERRRSCSSLPAG
jgi:AcrR family transcriptional regulator